MRHSSFGYGPRRASAGHWQDSAARSEEVIASPRWPGTRVQDFAVRRARRRVPLNRSMPWVEPVGLRLLQSQSGPRTTLAAALPSADMRHAGWAPVSQLLRIG